MGNSPMDDDHKTFLEMFWHPLTEKIAGNLLQSARDIGGILYREVIQASEAGDNQFESIISYLVEALKDRVLDVRRAAASLLLQSLKELNRSVMGASNSIPEELAPAIPALLNALPDQDYDMRLNVLSSIGIVVRCSPPTPIVQAVIQHTLTQGELILD